jgi:hypothetical protein
MAAIVNPKAAGSINSPQADARTIDPPASRAYSQASSQIGAVLAATPFLPHCETLEAHELEAATRIYMALVQADRSNPATISMGMSLRCPDGCHTPATIYECGAIFAVMSHPSLGQRERPCFWFRVSPPAPLRILLQSATCFARSRPPGMTKTSTRSASDVGLLRLFA